MCRRDDDRPVAILTKREARPPRDHGERALRFSEHFLQTGDFNEVYLELENSTRHNECRDQEVS